jgi:hypothetical protein
MDGGKCSGVGDVLPVITERRPRFGATVFVTNVLQAVLIAHVVEGAGDGGLPAFEDAPPYKLEPGLTVARRLPLKPVSRELLVLPHCQPGSWPGLRSSM